MAKATTDTGFTFTTDGKRITKMLESVLSRGSKLMTDVHVLNLCLLARAIDHSDADGASRLVNGLGGGFRRTAIINWMIAYGPFKWTKDKDKVKYPLGGKLTFDGDKAEQCKKDRASILKTAEADPFWEFEPEKEFKGIDILGLIKSTIERAEKAEQEADTPEKKAKLKLKGLVQLRKVYKELAE
jgi:hypothetical protein